MEHLSGYEPPSDNSEETETHDSLDTPHIEEVAELEQSTGGRLAKYITGLSLEDPRLADRMVEDQRIIRAKYHLPQLEMRVENPSEYERALRAIAESVEADIRDRSEFTQFFRKHLYAGAVHIPDGQKIAVKIDRGDLKSYSRDLGSLEHEVIHALQQRYYPSMPIELMEYEAYIAGGNMTAVQRDPEVARAVFNYLITISVMHWYRTLNEEHGENVVPPWAQ